MINQEKYKFEDFTIKNYQTIIQTAKKNEYLFAFFHEPYSCNFKQVLWRHDVEFSPFIALKMAEIEAAFGIKATCFVQLHSEFYNTLEKDTIKSILESKNLGPYTYIGKSTIGDETTGIVIYMIR